MKTGLGLRKKFLKITSYINLLRFSVRKWFLGFEYADIFLKRTNKESVQLILIKNGAHIGKNCDIETGLTFHNCDDYSNLILGDNVHIGKNCFFDLKDKIIIKDNVTISMECKFITHQDVGKSKLSLEYPASHNKIVIEAEVYVGVNSVILMGCNLGENSIIAAGSLVLTNITKNCIVAGVPAKSKKHLNDKINE